MAELVKSYDAIPDYDDWGNDSYWGLGDWVAWHRGLVKKYGRALDTGGDKAPTADRIWLNAWVKQGFGASPLLAIAQPSRFPEEAAYLKKYPLLYQNTGLKTIQNNINPLEISYKGAKAVANVADGISGTIAGVGNSLKMLKYIIPVVMLGGLTLGSIYVYNNFVKTK